VKTVTSNETFYSVVIRILDWKLGVLVHGFHHIPTTAVTTCVGANNTILCGHYVIQRATSKATNCTNKNPYIWNNFGCTRLLPGDAPMMLGQRTFGKTFEGV
jgi:hypothetical protein